MAVRGYEEEAMRPKSRAVEPNVEYCKPISNVATPSFKHGGCSSVGRVPDCGSEGHGFESHLPPKWQIISEFINTLARKQTFH